MGETQLWLFSKPGSGDATLTGLLREVEYAEKKVQQVLELDSVDL